MAVDESKSELHMLTNVKNRQGSIRDIKDTYGEINDLLTRTEVERDK